MSSFDKFAEGATKGASAGYVVGQTAEVALTPSCTLVGSAGTLCGIAISEAVIKPSAT